MVSREALLLIFWFDFGGYLMGIPDAPGRRPSEEGGSMRPTVDPGQEARFNRWSNSFFDDFNEHLGRVREHWRKAHPGEAVDTDRVFLVWVFQELARMATRIEDLQSEVRALRKHP
jgi:hypothetical protein